MVSFIWKYYFVFVVVVSIKWIISLDRLVVFFTRVVGKSFFGSSGRVWVGLCVGM